MSVRTIAKKKALSIGIIGLGSIGDRHVRNLRILFPDASIEVLTQRAKSPIPSILLNPLPENFFARAHDIYFITNETFLHTDTIITCLKKNPLGIFVEKPLTHETRDLPRIRKALKDYRGTFFVGYCLQFYQPLLELKKIIHSRTLGAIVSMTVTAGKSLKEWRTRSYTHSYSSSSKRGGGVILDLIHELNYPAWLLDESLKFIGGTAATVALPIDAEDIALSIFRSEHGTLVSVHQDYIQSPGVRSCVVVGTKGTATWFHSLKRGNKEHLITKETGTCMTRRLSVDDNAMYIDELRFFIQKVRSRVTYSNFEEAARDIKNAHRIKQNTL